MINIVTGRINSGKTSKLIKLYDELQKGDGFVGIKNMRGDKVIGYDMMRLSSRRKYPFIIREDSLTENWEECCRIGPYHFSRETLSYIEGTLRQLMKKGVSPIFLDEIGPLELDNQCFHNIFGELLLEGCELYVAVREGSLEDVIDKYNIRHKRIISL